MRLARTHRLSLTFLLLVIGLLPRGAAAEDARCFRETRHCASGRFEAYWVANGALPVFGLPLTTAGDELNRDVGKTYRTQWFERARFEWHPNKPDAFKVLLGLLGSELRAMTDPANMRPTQLRIPAIGLDATLMAVGLNEGRVPVVPRHDVGWYTAGATPGQGSNVILWGHVLRFQNTPNIPAPFARIHELARGAELMLTSADGKVRRYRVTQQLQAQPNDVKYLRPTVREQVTLISCIGDRVVTNGKVTLELRLVTIAEPVP